MSPLVMKCGKRIVAASPHVTCGVSGVLDCGLANDDDDAIVVGGGGSAQGKALLKVAH